MSKNTKAKDGRGRPRKELVYPKGRMFTVNDLISLNPNITCRLTLYTRRDELVKAREIRYTGQTIKTGGVGKPLFQMQSMVAFRKARNEKQRAKQKRLAKATVDLRPAPVAAPVAEPVAVAVA